MRMIFWIFWGKLSYIHPKKNTETQTCVVFQIFRPSFSKNLFFQGLFWRYWGEKWLFTITTSWGDQPAGTDWSMKFAQIFLWPGITNFYKLHWTLLDQHMVCHPVWVILKICVYSPCSTRPFRRGLKFGDSNKHQACTIQSNFHSLELPLPTLLIDTTVKKTTWWKSTCYNVHLWPLSRFKTTKKYERDKPWKQVNPWKCTALDLTKKNLPYSVSKFLVAIQTFSLNPVGTSPHHMRQNIPNSHPSLTTHIAQETSSLFEVIPQKGPRGSIFHDGTQGKKHLRHSFVTSPCRKV